MLTEQALHDSGVAVAEHKGVGGGLQVRGVNIDLLDVDVGDGVELVHEHDEVTHVDVVAHAVNDEEEVTPILGRLNGQGCRQRFVLLIILFELIFGLCCLLFRLVFLGLLFLVLLSIFLGFFFLQAAVGRAEHNGELEKKMNLFYVLSVYKLLTGFALAAYVIYLSCVVWRRNYLPPLTEMTAKQKALRELYFYFFRIVILFIAIWVPCVSLLLYANVTGRPWPILACSCAGAIQAIFTAGMILTKSDVRNYLYDFVTLSYFFNKEPEESRNSTLPTTPKAIAAGSAFTHSTVSGMKTPAHSVHHSDLDPLDQDVSASFYEESQNQNPETGKVDIADEESGSASKTESED